MNYSGPSRQSNKKYWYVGGATVVVVVLIFVITRSMQLAPNDETSGTIGGVKKYNAVQMSDQDIKLRTLLMSDTASLRDYLRTLKMLKDFAVAVNHDLELWKKDMTAMDTKVRVRKLKGGFTMQGKSEEFGEYANFITANIGVLDNMIAMLTKMAAADTAGKAFEIDRTFNDFENFRVKFGEKFQQVMNAVPEIHNTMVKNGLASGLLGSLDCRLQYVVGSGTIESHPIGSATLLGSGETVGCCLYSNGGAGGAGGLGANGPLLGSGEGGMGSVVGSNMIGSMILSRDQVFSFFGSHPLGVIVDGNVPLGSLGLGNGQLGAAFTNRP